MKRYFHNESGLTLVEILASIVILSIVLIAFMSFLLNPQNSRNLIRKN